MAGRESREWRLKQNVETKEPFAKTELWIPMIKTHHPEGNITYNTGNLIISDGAMLNHAVHLTTLGLSQSSAARLVRGSNNWNARPWRVESRRYEGKKQEKVRLLYEVTYGTILINLAYKPSGIAMDEEEYRNRVKSLEELKYFTTLTHSTTDPDYHDINSNIYDLYGAKRYLDDVRLFISQQGYDYDKPSWDILQHNYLGKGNVTRIVAIQPEVAGF